MPIYYNPASPTPSTKNTINSVAVTYGLRDFLLNKNLLPTSMLPAGYSTNTAINGSPKVGQPVLDTMVNTGSNIVPNYLPLETEGIVWKDLNVLPNTFKNNLPNANDLVGIDLVLDTNYLSPDGLTSFGSAEWPQGVSAYPNGIENYGLLAKTKNAKFKLGNVKKNLYLDESKQYDVADFVYAIPNDITQQINGYLDVYGGLNFGTDNSGGGGTAVQAANVIGSVLNGQGLGLAKGGIVTNFDVRSSLAGRVLGATGLMKDSKLGTIGGQQLALALANNAAFNIQEDLLGALSIKGNVLSAIKGDGFGQWPRPSYKISIPKGNGGRVLDYAAKVLGFTLPRSYMNDDGSIFQSETGEVENINRANDLLLTTGKGQLQALISNINRNIIGTSPDGHDNPKNTKFRTGYAPAYIIDNKGDEKISDGILYAFYKDGNIMNLFRKEDDIISDLNYLREEKVEKYGFESYPTTDYSTRPFNNRSFSWGSTEPGLINTLPTSDNGYVHDTYSDNYTPIIGNKKSLLVKTQTLFNSKGMKTIVSREGELGIMSDSQTVTTNGGGISKGSAVLSGLNYDKRGNEVSLNPEKYTVEDVYCRSWTTRNRYDSVEKLIRNDALYTADSGKVPFRFNTENTVLEDTGFVKIAPYTNDFLGKDSEVSRNAKNYMFSIENLAWNDAVEQLPKGEVGLGDPLTGKKGRIMWFPPYDIQISESVSVDWEAHKFIGRGENIYTYNNTERTGQLSFKIIVDHSTYVNAFRGQNGPDDNYVASFMAGCVEPDSFWTDRFTLSQNVRMQSKPTIPQKKVTPPVETPPDDLFVFFPNDQATVPILYEAGVSGSTGGSPDYNQPIDYNVYLSPTYNGPHFGLGTYPSNFTYKTVCANNNGVHKTWPDTHNYGMNYSTNSPKTPISVVGSETIRGFFDKNTLGAYSKYIEEKCPHCKINVIGHASPQGRAACNQQLSDARADNIVSQLKSQWCPAIGWSQEKCDKKVKKLPSYQIKASESQCNPKTGSATDTYACKYDRRVRIQFEYVPDEALAEVAPPDPCITTTQEQITDSIRQKFYNETMFFDKLEKNNRFVFDKFREKIRYFHPAFHSTTPEGFNSRLTFLHQCTRQGPTLEEQGANNLAFGRAPVCILRVGDFFYTKIVIDSLSIDYEPLVWDLNPEGIGVQPMIANVSLSFKFIGAESLYGPINKLQNALSFNFYANTRVYEARADYISQKKETSSVTEKKVNGNKYQETTVSVDDSATSPTGLYLNNGLTTVNPEISSFVKEKGKQNSCETDQSKANEQAITSLNNQNAASPPPPAPPEPKITGFKYVNINGVYGSDIKKIVSVTLKQENIEKMLPDFSSERLLTDDQFKKFLEKGLKIVIEGSPTPSSSSRYEEVVKWGGNGFKDPWYLFGGGYCLGTEEMVGSPVIDLPISGNYTLSVYYNNNKIQSVPVKVGVVVDTAIGTSEEFQEWY